MQIDDGRRARDYTLHAYTFSVLWAVAHLAHALRKEPVNDSLSWLYILACVLLIQRPSSLARLSALCLVQIAMFFDRLPLTDNHMYIMAFVNAGLLVVILPRALRREGWDARSFDVAKTYTLVVFATAYLAAALSKLNRDFLFTDASCSLTMLDDAVSIVGLDRAVVPASLVGLVPFVVAGVEMAIPLLVLIGRTRAVGIVLAVVFHLGISISPTATAVDFTIIIFAILALLVPVDGRMGRIGPLIHLGRYRKRGPLDWETGALLLLFFVLVVFRWRLGTVAGNRSWIILAAAALLLGAALVIAALKRREALADYRVSLRKLHVVHYPFLLLLLVNVASPYLGLKTAGTFTMYSNLNTYDYNSNHYLFPRVPYRTPHDDLVQVIATSNERLNRFREEGLLVTWHRLRRELARDPDASISYVRGGKRFTYEQASQNPELVTLDPFLHKVLAHRAHAAVQGSCLW